jgi:hypothetical protein
VRHIIELVVLFALARLLPLIVVLICQGLIAP